MNAMNDLGQMRANALKQMDNAQRFFKLSLFGAVLFEAFFTGGIIYFADWRNPQHLLIVSCTGLVYMPVILGLVALGAHMNRSILRVLARLDDVK
jgi:hypothetical protein